MGLVLEKQGDHARAAEFYERAGNMKRAEEVRALGQTRQGAVALTELQARGSKPDGKPAEPPRHGLPTVIPDDPPSNGHTPVSHMTPAATNGRAAADAPRRPGAEAAALVAAQAAHQKRPSEPPSQANVEEVRGASLGFTLDVDDARAAAPSSMPAVAPSPRLEAVPDEATIPLPGKPEPPPPPPAEARPPAPAAAAVPLEPPRPAQPAIRPQRIAELLSGALSASAVTRRDDGLLVFPIQDTGYVRTDVLVSLAGQFELEPVNRRYRGKRTESLFGGNDSAVVALMGKGLAVVDPGKLEVAALQLKQEEIFLVENVLLAFSSGLVWENGRLPSDTDKDLDIVHLRGSGQILLATRSNVVSLEVKKDQPVTAHASRLVGWNGQLVPYRGPLPGLPENARRPPIVRFEGTGVVLTI
jgi:hypothetical protein